uniref:Uncharacterized protein n=1 Tax=Ananas comosus var. bracteatus TaxID=296719 RepID=A0A6V7PCT9_ANACO|nr:unnamed protein product [Ananas comosus var. bracteatus]
MDGMEKVAREFFMLPLEEKEKYPMAPGTIQGYGHAFVFSEDQKLDWCNMLALGVAPPFIRNSSLWPTNPAHFRCSLRINNNFIITTTATRKHVETNVYDKRKSQESQSITFSTHLHCSETLEMYTARIRNLCERLLIVIAETLGLAPNTFGDMFGRQCTMNYYPPCSRPDLVLGLSSHSDGSALTVLQQDATCAGL